MPDVDELLPAEIMVTVTGVKDHLRLHSLQGREGLGLLFEYRLDLVNWDESDVVRNQLSAEGSLSPQALLGKDLTVTLPLAGGKTRIIHGLVTHAAFRASIDHHTAYAVTIRPELWLLTLSQNCRVFQGATVPDVLKEILNDHGIGVPREALSRPYRTWDTLTQYRESDFDFINRLLAHEGLYYFFEHGPQGHTLVLADSPSSHREHPDFSTIAMGKPKPIAGSDEHLRTWQPAFCLESEEVTLTDFDFRLRRPSAKILGTRVYLDGDGPALPEGRARSEIYDFPAQSVLAENQEEATGKADPCDSRMEAGHLASIRQEAQRCRATRHQGQGTVRWLSPGMLFSVEGCDGQQFLATETELTLRNPAFLTGESTIEEPCELAVTALDSTTPFRMLPADKPRILGPQTAWVVGEKDEEIWTDKYGRIQVHFHWDRERRDERGSACWVRVAQPWAGNRWGTFSIPRVGSEVVVEFLYGDPDRPLVTGSVYGGENLPPYDLPEHKTRSGIKTRSSKSATAANYNEIRFEDKKGHEELHIQAERNLTVLVKHDQTMHIHGKRDVTVKNGDLLRVIGSNKSVSVDGGYDIGTNRHFNLQVCTTGVDYGGKEPAEVLPEGTATVSASTEIRFVCGESSLSLKRDGTIEMKGTQLTLTGSNLVEAHGKQVTVTGSEKVELNGNGATLDMSEAINTKGTQVTVTGTGGVHLKVPDATTLDMTKQEVVIKGPSVALN
jgi:type VI secretion system secreted protein VgrG